VVKAKAASTAVLTTTMYATGTLFHYLLLPVPIDPVNWHRTTPPLPNEKKRVHLLTHVRSLSRGLL
jgi:hypothetical protein